VPGPGAGVGIREAGPQDADLLANVVHRIAAHYEEGLAEPPDVTADRLRRLRIGPDGLVQALIAEQDDRVVGAAFFNVQFPGADALPCLYLKDLYVDPTARRSGIAQALLSRLAALTLERGFERLDWSTDSANTAAMALYDGIGAALLDSKRFWRLDRTALRRLTDAGTATQV